MARKMHVDRQVFPIAGRFSIARGSRTEAVVVTVTLTQDGATGRGECVPYARYGETVEGVIAAIERVRGALESGLDRQALQEALPPGAARNAVDCALWDLEAKRTGVPAYVAAGLDRVRPATTASVRDPRAIEKRPAIGKTCRSTCILRAIVPFRSRLGLDLIRAGRVSPNPQQSEEHGSRGGRRSRARAASDV